MSQHPVSREITIQSRDQHFQFSDANHRDWHSDDPLKSLVYNGLSLTFPAGERFFIRTVKRFQKEISDPVLSEQIRGFVKQEALHTREHVEYNQELEAQGFRAAKIHSATHNRLDLATRRLSPVSQLAVTCALEHFTAILAHELLTKDAYLEGADKTYQQIWLWHALEEAEHKGVAYDTLMEVTNGRIYWKRCGIMLLTSAIFMFHMVQTYAVLMKDIGKFASFSSWGRLTWLLWGRPGLFRGMMRHWLDYFRPGFHPWNHDNRYEMAMAPFELSLEEAV